MNHPANHSPACHGDRLYRFGAIERLVHWINAFAFFLLLATGLMLFFRVELLLTRPQVEHLRRWHFYIGIFYWLLPATLFLAGAPRACLAWWIEAFRWSGSDFLWLMGPLRKVLLRGRLAPEVGRFNAGQRLNMLAQMLVKPVLAASGILIYVRLGTLLPFLLHLIGSAILVFLVAGHIYMSVLHPATRESVTAMIDGYIRAEFAEHHHPAWYRSIRKKAETADRHGSDS